MSPSNSCVRRRGMAAVLFLVLVWPSVAGKWDDDCTNVPPSEIACTDVGNDWSTLQSSIANANDGDYIVYCPFSIETDGTAAEPKSQARFACKTPGDCIFTGSGQHLKFKYDGAETLFYGFTFQGSTNIAVRVRSESTKEQLFCRCSFQGNSGDNRGGGLLTEADTLVSLTSCTFEGNSAGRGGAVYNRGHLIVSDTSFTDNIAGEGAAIAISSYASIEIGGSTFQNNVADEGPSLWGEADLNDVPDYFVDAGGNVMNDDLCKGFYNSGDDDTCYPFGTNSTSTASPVPSQVPSSASAVPTTSVTLLPTPSPSPDSSFFPSTISPSPDSSLFPSTISPSPDSSLFPSTISPSPDSSLLASTTSPSPDSSLLASTMSPSPDSSLFPSTISPSPDSTMQSSTAQSQSAVPSAVLTASSPSLVPTDGATNSSLSSQTAGPTQAPVTYVPPPDPENEMLPLVSRDQKSDYYNFNILDNDYGPDAWEDVDISENEFVKYEKDGLDVSGNECGQSGDESPIDLHYVNAECTEFHQIRARGGDWKNLTKHGEIIFQVTPTNLRMQVEGGNVLRPRADSPGGFTGDLYVDHLEITTPSLHTIDGQRYDAEYSIYVPQAEKNRILALSVLIDASMNQYNNEFQKMLNAWGQVEGCGLSAGRRLTPDDIVEGEAETIDSSNYVDANEERRLAQNATIDGKFNIFSPDLVRTIYWFAYEGSLVKPPCTKSVHWRVYDTPMPISNAQLEQLRSILSDGPCRDDPNRQGLGESLARPTQRTHGRKVWHCTVDDFLSDCERFGLLCPAPPGS